jgi:hypothetical protein
MEPVRNFYKPYPKTLARSFYILVLAVGVLALVNFGMSHVQASKEVVNLDAQYEVEGLPGCSYGYGQCRKGCEAEEGLIPLIKNANSQCLTECNFLYGGCKEASS